MTITSGEFGVISTLAFFTGSRPLTPSLCSTSHITPNLLVHYRWEVVYYLCGCVYLFSRNLSKKAWNVILLKVRDLLIFMLESNLSCLYMTATFYQFTPSLSSLWKSHRRAHLSPPLIPLQLKFLKSVSEVQIERERKRVKHSQASIANRGVS